MKKPSNSVETKEENTFFYINKNFSIIICW